MKYILLILLVTILMSETCKNKKNTTSGEQSAIDSIPSCIRQRIDSVSKEPRYNPPAQVNEYNYLGKRVFLFSSDCCDFFEPLYDSACNYMGAPHGGITGRGDGNLPDFDKQARHIKLVWKDPR